MGVFDSFRATVSPSVVFLTLDVLEIMGKQQRQGFILSKDDKAILKRAINFLKMAEKGQRILRRTEGKLVADIVSINHIGYVSSALGDSRSGEIDKILKTSKTALQNVAKGIPFSETISQDINATIHFFKVLSKLSLDEFASINYSKHVSSL